MDLLLLLVCSTIKEHSQGVTTSASIAKPNFTNNPNPINLLTNCNPNSNHNIAH